MDVGDLLTAASVIGTGVGGFVGGRITGRSSAGQIASQTVQMLQAQVVLLQEDKEQRERELSDLRGRVTVLENLVTQRAEVEELSNRVSLVKNVVDRIAERVGA